MNNNMTTAAVHGSFDILGKAILKEVEKENDPNRTSDQRRQDQKDQLAIAMAAVAAGLHVIQATFDRLDQISASLRQLAENDQIRLERERSI